MPVTRASAVCGTEQKSATGGVVAFARVTSQNSLWYGHGYVASPTLSSRYERLIDRWIDLTRWPTAKKTALAMGIAVVFHLVVLTLALLAVVTWSPGLVNAVQVARSAAIAVVCVVAILAVSVAVARRRREGRWTAYLLIFMYAPVVVRLLSLFGTVSGPWLVVPLLLILLAPVFFDPRVGRVAFGYFSVILIGVSVLELSGRIPFAPAMQLRSLDAQLTPGWYVGVYIIALAAFAYVYLLVEFLVVVRERQQQLLEAAHQALGQANTKLHRGMDLIRRYVPAQLAEELLTGELHGDRSHQRRKLTLFFSDIKDFAGTADSMEPEDLSTVLNEYLSEMSNIAQRRGGTVDKFVGDAIVVFFGAPVATTDRDHALRAVHMAMEMQARMVALREKWRGEGMEHPFEIRIGINTGQASVGNFGSEERLDYTAIGRHVNLAARLQSHCVPGKVLLSHATWVLVEDQIECVAKGKLQVKGFRNPVEVYEVVGLRATVAVAPS